MAELAENALKTAGGKTSTYLFSAVKESTYFTYLQNGEIENIGT